MRVVVLGPGGSGKSTVSRRLAAITGVECIELDKHFWGPQLEPTSPDHWVEIQADLVRRHSWIMDGDLGPYDVVEVRLHGADAVVVLDLPISVCAWRALRRSKESTDFWLWLFRWRRRYRPQVTRAIAEHAARADIFFVRRHRDIERVIGELCRRGEGVLKNSCL